MKIFTNNNFDVKAKSIFFLYKFFVFIFFYLYIYNVSAQSNIFAKLYSSSKVYDSTNILFVDTVLRGSVKFIIPKTNSIFLNKVLLIEQEMIIKNKNYVNAIITYQVKQFSNEFVSIIRNVYQKDDMSPRGFFMWDVCKNYLKVGAKIYFVFFDLKSNFRNSIKTNMDILECKDVEIITSFDDNIYINKGNLYIHNPYDSPFCNIDFGIKYSNVIVNFKDYKNIRLLK